MLITYIVDNTSGSLSFQIKPGELDGPGGQSRHTDIRLYGNGALRWGEGVDEGLLRLVETFACDRKQTGDYNPATGLNDYDMTVDDIRPRDENDLGAGFGITTPINGQQWYCNGLKKIYAYDEPNDKWLDIASVDATAPIGIPKVGNLWYNPEVDFNLCSSGELLLPQLMIYESDAEGWVSVAHNYVSKYGDWMDGILDMGGADGWYANDCQAGCTESTTKNRIINVEDPVCDYDAANRKFVEDEDAKQGTNLVDLATVLQDHLANRAGRVPTQDTNLTINGIPFSFEDNYHLTGNEETMLRFVDFDAGISASNIGAGLHRINLKLDTELGGTMTGALSLISVVPSINDDWKAVPVKMLREHVQGVIDDSGFDRKLIYTGTAHITPSVLGRAVDYTFDFTSWVTDYEARTGESIHAGNEFYVLPNIYWSSLRLANPSPVSSQTKGTYGDYSYGVVNSEVVQYITTSTSYKIKIKLGSSGMNASFASRYYSTGVYIDFHLTFIGGRKYHMISSWGTVL